jgi:competence protein ComEC
MQKNKNKLVIIIILILLNYFFWQEIFSYHSRENLLEINFLDIGQGDAILIQDSYNNQILIDGGKGNEIINKLTEHLPIYDHNIEVVLLTHPDYDHLGGLVHVLENYEVDHFFHSGLKKPTHHFEDLMNLLEDNKINAQIARQGLCFLFPNQAKLNILYPTSSLVNIETENFNEYSVISKLILGNFSLLLPGDAGFTLEEKLLENNVDLKSRVLKVGHHGSKYSTTASFLKAISPQVAVISVGKNPYGHPHPDLLERLKNIPVFRTDKDGDVTILTDGNSLNITKELFLLE